MAGAGLADGLAVPSAALRADVACRAHGAVAGELITLGSTPVLITHTLAVQNIAVVATHVGTGVLAGGVDHVVAGPCGVADDFHVRQGLVLGWRAPEVDDDLTLLLGSSMRIEVTPEGVTVGGFYPGVAQADPRDGAIVHQSRRGDCRPSQDLEWIAPLGKVHLWQTYRAVAGQVRLSWLCTPKLDREAVRVCGAPRPWGALLLGKAPTHLECIRMKVRVSGDVVGIRVVQRTQVERCALSVPLGGKLHGYSNAKPTEAIAATATTRAVIRMVAVIVTTKNGLGAWLAV